MYGIHVNKLTMYVQMNGVRSQIWQKVGNQGNKWINGKVDATVYNNNQIVFEGATGTSYMGDIALDDIYIFNGPCQSTSSMLSKP